MRFVDGLMRHLTQWKGWYAILAAVSVVLGSVVGMLPTLLAPSGEDGTTPGFIGFLATSVPMVALAALALIFVRIASGRWPTVEDLGLRPGLSGRHLLVITATFIVTHLVFWLLGRGGPSTEAQAVSMFNEMGLGKPGSAALGAVISVAVLAPVCEELLYRGVMLRSLHDAIARRGRMVWAVLVSVAVSAVMFAMPRIGDATSVQVSAAFLLTGIAFSLVYVVTGSLTAAMVSHALQSCFAWGQVLLLGHGDADVPLLYYVIVFGCPVWTWLCAVALWQLLPKSTG